MTLLDKFYTPAILEPAYSFSESGEYFVPADDSGSYAAYVEHIRSLPMLAKPEVFGLHANADITKDQNETLQLFRSILLTQVRFVPRYHLSNPHPSLLTGLYRREQVPAAPSLKKMCWPKWREIS